ncbi:MAG: hypothetical protein AAF678_12335 [Pseudomonadota bacterium]
MSVTTLTGAADADLARETDALILSAAGATVISNQLIERLACYQFGQISEYRLDGKPIIRFWPIEVAERNDGGRYELKLVRRYQILCDVPLDPANQLR